MTRRSRPQTGTILERLQASQDDLPAAQQRLVAFLVAHYKAAAFDTAAQIGRQVGVSEATVVRFAAGLGYRGFPEFQQALKERVLQELTTLERLRDYHLEIDGRRPNVLGAIVQHESENAARLLHVNKPEAVRQWGQAFRSARHVAVYGAQGSAPLAQFLAFHLNKGRHHVACFPTPDIVAYHSVSGMTRRDVLCVIGFPRYPRLLVDLARFAHERGLRVLALTDSEVSPLAPLGAPTLIAPTTPLTFVDGYAGAICLMTAVLTEFARGAPGSVRRSLAQYEEVARRTGVFLQP